MSLVALALRTTLWRALRGQTMAGDRVYDSQVAPIADFLAVDAGGPSPFISISTDDETADYDGTHNYVGADRSMDLVLEMALASAQADPAGLEIPHTDEGLELSLNYLGRQVQRVLQVDSEWGDLFRAFSHQTVRSTTRRGAASEGTRYAARQVILTYKPLFEPEFGMEPYGEWARLLAAMAGDEFLGRNAEGLRLSILGEAIPTWARMQSTLGATRSGLVTLGLGPFLPAIAPALLRKATIEGDVRLQAEAVVAAGEGTVR